jgi:hypothetical protein
MAKSDFQTKLEEFKKLLDEQKLFFPPTLAVSFEAIDYEMINAQDALLLFCTPSQFDVIREMAWGCAGKRIASNRATMMYLYERAYAGFAAGESFEKVLEIIKDEIEGLKAMDILHSHYR